MRVSADATWVQGYACTMLRRPWAEHSGQRLHGKVRTLLQRGGGNHTPWKLNNQNLS